MDLVPVSPVSVPRLRDRDAAAPDEMPSGDELKERTAELLDRLDELQNIFYADRRRALLVVLQGRDASGKDGVVRKVFGACSPMGCQVTGFGVPSEEERAHDYLWRVHRAIPPKGVIGIFNRSHYEDVLVVRVKDIVPKKEWSKRYDQINQFERMLTENGVVILKFFLHISRDEQRERLLDRLDDRRKNWKFRAGDLDDRELWPQYTRAYADALRKCSTPWAPWYIVPADSKKSRDYLIARTLVATLEGLPLEYPAVSSEARKLRKKLS
jgi:PPK2 family polyphosphate:nucleotide phosphotransferase